MPITEDVTVGKCKADSIKKSIRYHNRENLTKLFSNFIVIYIILIFYFKIVAFIHLNAF